MTRLLTSTKWPRSARVLASSFACMLTLATMQALAEPTAAERGLAAALFEQARTLMTSGMLEEACGKFAESQRLDPGGGTLLNLALCHEKQGKIATAWTEFREARSMAKRDNRPDREGAADAEIAKLEPQLFKLSVVVAPDVKLPGLAIEIDGLPLPDIAWGTPFPVDPGKRTIIAKAPGYREWKTVVEVRATPGTADIPVPKLVKADTTNVPPVPTGTAQGSASAGPNNPPPLGSGAVSTTKPPKAEPDLPMHPTRKTGFVLGGVGLGFVGIGAIVGGVAISKNNEANDACPTTTCGNGEIVELSRTAVKLASVSNVMVGLGLAGMAIGTVMIAISPKSAPIETSVSLGPQSISVTGKF